MNKESIKREVFESKHFIDQPSAKVLAIAIAVSGLAQAACGARFTVAPDETESSTSTGGSGGETCEPTNPSDEVCDGVDNDCDINTEDGSADPELGAACDTNLEGICGSGVKACGEEGLECIPDNQPQTELCNSNEDEDCDGDTGCYDSDCSDDTLNCRYTVVSDGTEVVVMADSNDNIVDASLTDGACGPMSDVIGNPGSNGSILMWKPGTSPSTEIQFAAGEAPVIKYHCSTTFAANACPGTVPTNTELITEYQNNYPAEYSVAPYSIENNTVTVTMTGLCNGGPYELIAEVL